MEDDDGALVVAAATMTVGAAASDDVSTIEVRSNDMFLRRYRTAGMERTAIALIMLYALLALAMFALMLFVVVTAGVGCAKRGPTVTSMASTAATTSSESP